MIWATALAKQVLDNILLKLYKRLATVSIIFFWFWLQFSDFKEEKAQKLKNKKYYQNIKGKKKSLSSFRASSSLKSGKLKQ